MRNERRKKRKEELGIRNEPEFSVLNSQFSISFHPVLANFGFRISDLPRRYPRKSFEFSVLSFELLTPFPASPFGLRRDNGGRSLSILPARETGLYSPRGAPPAPSMRHNQPRMPSITPTPRKVAVGANRRRLRSELRPHPKEEAMSHAQATVLRDGRRPSATQRGFPRAGGRGVGAGKKEFEGVPPARM